MKYIHFEASGMLAGLAAMLECCGHHTEDYQIALGMNAPWLFLQENDHYRAGRGLYTPRWMNLYLCPHGFHLAETLLPKDEVPAFLRLHQPAMLPVSMGHDVCHPVVCTSYENGRYSIVNVKTAASSEPDHISLSRPMLLRRLDDETRVLTLEKCPPESVDFIPLLVQSLQVLRDYERAMMELCKRSVTREELNDLHAPLLRALLVDMQPMSLLLHQPILYEELRLLRHDYRHIFTRNSPPTVELWERLPLSSIRQCISWMTENIIDRLYDHGVTDEQMQQILFQVTDEH